MYNCNLIDKQIMVYLNGCCSVMEKVTALNKVKGPL